MRASESQLTRKMSTMLGFVPGRCWDKVVRACGVDSFLEDEGLARTALSCHLSVNLLCQEMSDG